MKKINPVRNFLLLPFFIFLSCIPDTIKTQMDEGMQQAQEMFADQEFKKAIGIIELHKLRNGQYPISLQELKFLGPMDSTIFQFVEYKRMDTVYELNVKSAYPTLTGKRVQQIQLKYPKLFWKGLGCRKSNAME